MAIYPPGTRIGSYEIAGRLGAGGMGEVYRAHDPRLRRDVAIKVLPAEAMREPDKRADPSLLMPGCRSVVTLAMNYWPGERRRERAGRVARYAWGRDYHRVIGARAARLAAWMAEESGESATSHVDIAPILERGWAERSGIGWIGFRR